MTDATTPEQPRTALLARIPALLEQHAGHESWGENDGRLDSVLLAWGLNPTDFMESLLGWGYTIAIEAQARPAVASEHPMTYCEPCSQCRQRLASDTRSVGALDAERLARDEALLLMSTVSASIKHYLRTGFVADDPLIRGLRRIHNKLIRIWQLDAAAYDAEGQGES